MKPIIGITARTSIIKGPTGDGPNYTVDHTYVAAIVAAGGVPLLLVPIGAEAVASLLDRVDGVLLTGGGDIEPSRYGGEYHSDMYGIEEDRDDFEIELVRIAAERRIPLLAICRGCQVVNVALGGTLIEDVHSMVDDSQHHFKQGEAVYNELHRVLIDPDSRLAGLLGTNEALVNSLHHQGIRKPAPGLTAIAFADDGVVEGLQHEDADWPMAAVQWHPEYMVRTGDEPARRLFGALIEWARDAMKA